MRIERLELIRYGCFTDRVLDLSGPGVHLIVGPNEAGKSTIRQAFSDLLYGIHERTTLGFLHEMRDLRITARVRGGSTEQTESQSPTLDLVRLKQRKAPLQTPEGEPLPESALAALLSGIDRTQFESTFAIDHEELRIGGRQLLAGDGDLGAALFETSTNRRLAGMLETIDEEMGRLFKRNAQNPVVNATLSRIGDARKQLDASLLRPVEYNRVARKLDDAAKKRKLLNEEFHRADAEYARLKRTMETKPLLADLARLQEEHAELDTTLSGFTADASTSGQASGQQYGQLAAQVAEVRERATRARSDAERAAADHADVVEKLAALVVDDAILAAAGDVERLHSERQAVQEAGEQERRERKRAEKAVAQARQLAGSGRPDGSAYEGVSIGDRAGALRAALAGVRAAELLPMATDKAKQVAKLDRAVRALREKHGLPETVSDWPHVPVPARDQVAAFKKQFAQFEDRRRELARHREETARALADDRRDLAAVLAGDPPPSDAELAAARTARDAAWTRLRGTVLTAESGAEFDKALRLADALVDRMRREAQRQTERLRLEVAVSAGEQALNDLDTQSADLDRELAETRTRWDAAWLPSALPAPDPNAATELLAGIEALVGKAEELADTQVDLDVCRVEIEAAEVRLRQVLGYVGGFPATDATAPTATAGAADLSGAVLAELVELAEQRRADYEAAEKQWEKADALFAEAAELEATAAAKAERVSRFAESVAAVVAAYRGPIEPSAAEEGSLPENALSADPYSVVASLRERLQEAQHNATVAGELRARKAKLDEELASSADALAATATDLARLIEVAGVEDEAQLDALVERAAAAVDLTRRIRDLTSLLTRTGVPLPTLILEAADWPDPDELAVRVAALKEAREERHAELDAASEEYGSRRNELEAMDGSAAAAEAAERLAEQQAVLIEQSEEYLRLYLGKQVLLQCVEEYRQANQDPVLARAKEIFTTLTGGRFTELLADQDQHGRDVLRVRRANGAVVGIGRELSEGTLDQVYLSLRLAAIQRFADADRTMPLVFDDIFITSDDARTAAGLTALDAVADQFQVVVFTHHGHLADLARTTLPAGRIHVTELPSSAS